MICELCKRYIHTKGLPSHLKHKHSITTFEYHSRFSNFKYLDRNWLYEQRIVKERSCRDIANECGVNKSWIHNIIHKFNISWRRNCIICGIEFKTYLEDKSSVESENVY